MSLDRRSKDRRKNDQRLVDRRRENRRHSPAMPVSSTEPRTQEDVDQIRGHLEYELRVVRETSDYLSAHDSRVGEVDFDAFLESFMLHVTFLLDFFFPTVQSRSRDPMVLEFTPEWADRETISELLNRVRNKADTLLGGMSYYRIEMPTKKELAAVYAELEALRSRFELLLNIKSHSLGDEPIDDGQGAGQR